MLSYLVEDLAHKGKPQEAKGIMLRNHVDAYVRDDILEKLKDLEYDQSKDSSLTTYDAFEPLSKPEENYIHLPAEVKVHTIATEKEVPLLRLLLNEPLVGVDSEWRPQLSQYNKTKPSLLQISGANDVFLVDLVSLQKSKVLDDVLTEVFSNKGSTIIGFGFSSDVEQFA
mmetsp:Transcript_22294/g.34490  ORF Transcript_22294/g.34490 Transcript_22294/m.34490 type:complete len:170 (+) Transcript_22294:1036-1545(+)